MAYFSNATEHMIYDETWCSKCHFQPRQEPYECDIMFLHALYNFDQLDKDTRGADLGTCLRALIPQDEGHMPMKCNFFIERQRHCQCDLLDSREWNEEPKGA